jgi:DJ-1/PfpI family
MTLETTAFEDPAFDTVIVGSITGMEVPPSDANLIALVQAASKASRRTASICSGAFVLAEAGLLDGRRATMHWAHAASFRARFPDVRTEEDRIYINDGPMWTSAGMTAGIDLVLALINDDLGPEATKMVAWLLVMNQRRLGGQTQHSALLDMTPKSDRIELVLAHIRQNLRNALSIEELAVVASLSPPSVQPSLSCRNRPVTGKSRPPADALAVSRRLIFLHTRRCRNARLFASLETRTHIQPTRKPRSPTATKALSSPLQPHAQPPRPFLESAFTAFKDVADRFSDLATLQSS